MLRSQTFRLRTALYLKNTTDPRHPPTNVDA